MFSEESQAWDNRIRRDGAASEQGVDYRIGQTAGTYTQDERDALLAIFLCRTQTGVFLFDPVEGGRDFLLAEMNETGQRLCRIDLERIRGKSVLDVFPELGRTEHLEIFRNAYKTGQSHSLPLARYEEGRISEWIEMHISRLPSGRIAVFHENRTEQHSLEERIRRSEKMEAIGQLAGGIAHDFNNILSGILGYAELALNKSPDRENWHRYLRNIIKAGDRAKNLVDQILTFSRQSSDSKEVQPLIPVIHEVEQLLRASLPSTIDLYLQLSEETGTVLVNSTKIHEILINLCTNAAHAMGNKGILEIRFEEVLLESPRFGILGEMPAGAYAMISVKDTGCGMDEALISRIFEPFFTTKDTGEGTGMGLAVVFGIVKDHSGNIAVFSEKGLGSEFRIYLPRRTEENSLRRMEDGLPLRGGEHIVFVDDEENNCEIVSEMLNDLGYKITAFSDSLDAFRYIKKDSCTIDMVITDQTMPFMTGLELSEEIQSIRKGIPIILCTGYSKDLDEELISRYGIADILQKPFRLHELSGKIRAVLNLSVGK